MSREHFSNLTIWFFIFLIFSFLFFLLGESPCRGGYVESPLGAPRHKERKEKEKITFQPSAWRLVDN